MLEPMVTLRDAVSRRYVVERELGRGGMATVYLARDRKHDRKVAVKVLSPDVAAALGAEWFLREIAIATRLTHPHILPLIGVARAYEPVGYGGRRGGCKNLRVARSSYVVTIDDRAASVTPP